jgi:catechol 2,3-dioxygenase-like lactoylglutathione lyase family enzyme
MDRQSYFPSASDSLCPSTDAQYDVFRPRAVTTRDHAVIKQWADRHRAVPATGEATPSGPATVSVTDGGTGLRFNFPGVARFRPISWEEWLAHFDAHGLTFVYEEAVADRAYALFEARGRQHGRDQEDWFEAERQLRMPAVPSARYHLIQE